MSQNLVDKSILITGAFGGLGAVMSRNRAGRLSSFAIILRAALANIARRRSGSLFMPPMLSRVHQHCHRRPRVAGDQP
jgi:hypothetical protein